MRILTFSRSSGSGWVVEMEVYRAKFGEPELGWVVLVHGLGEHSGRYGRLIRELNEAGFAV